MSAIDTVVESLHGRHVHGRRVRTLAARFTSLLAGYPSARILDVGCGDGRLDQLILQSMPTRVEIEGIDVRVRPNACIPTREFDGSHIPYPNSSFDVVMFVDVLHHTIDPNELLDEAVRVLRPNGIVAIKDHLLRGLLARPTLRFMDYIGNARHGVALPYNYWSGAQWNAAFRRVGLDVARWEQNLGLYPIPFNVIFGRSLHFIAALRKSAPLNQPGT